MERVGLQRFKKVKQGNVVTFDKKKTKTNFRYWKMVFLNLHESHFPVKLQENEIDFTYSDLMNT